MAPCTLVCSIFHTEEAPGSQSYTWNKPETPSITRQQSVRELTGVSTWFVLFSPSIRVLSTAIGGFCSGVEAAMALIVAPILFMVE